MVRGSLITFAFQVAALAIGIGSRILLARMLHDRGLGLFTIFVFIPTFLHAASNLGLNFSIVNFIGRKRFDAKAMSGLALSGGLLITIITLAVGAVIFTILRHIFQGHDLVELPNTAVVLAILIYIPYMLWFCNLSVHLGRNRLVAYNIVWILQPVVAFAGYLAAWFLLPGDANIVTKSAWTYLSYSLGILVALTAGLIILARGGLLRWAYPKGALKESALFGVQTHIGSFVGFLGLRLNIPFLNYLMGPASVGIFAITMIFGEAFKRIFSSISIALLPIASSAEGDKAGTLINVVLRNTIFICLITLGIFALICKPVILFMFKDEFASSVTPTIVILIWVFFTSLNKVFQSDAVGRGKPIWITYATLSTFVFLFAFSWVLVPRIGVMGAAWASTISSVAGFLLWLTLYITMAKGFSLAHAIVVKPKDFGRIYRKLLTLKKAEKSS